MTFARRLYKIVAIGLTLLVGAEVLTVPVLVLADHLAQAGWMFGAAVATGVLVSLAVELEDEHTRSEWGRG